jgi:hypothetical protein
MSHAHTSFQTPVWSLVGREVPVFLDFDLTVFRTTLGAQLLHPGVGQAAVSYPRAAHRLYTVTPSLFLHYQWNQTPLGDTVQRSWFSGYPLTFSLLSGDTGYLSSGFEEKETWGVEGTNHPKFLFITMLDFRWAKDLTSHCPSWRGRN